MHNKITAQEIIQNSVRLVKREGIFYTDNDVSVSYPNEGNQLSLQLEDNSFWFKHRNHCILSMIKQFPPTTPIICEVGCGNGYVTLGIQKAGFETIAVEPMLPGAMNSKERGIKFVICGALEDAGLKRGSLPAIGLFDVLEHIEDDIGYLSSLKYFLPSNGKVYLTVPSYRWLWSNYDDVAGHYRRYTINGLKKVFNEAGYRCDYMSYFFSFLPLPIFLTRSIPSRIGLLVDSQDNNERVIGDHNLGTNFVSKTINALCNLEARLIDRGKVMLMGGSCLITATKL